jgi:hypothetical protein
MALAQKVSQLLIVALIMDHVVNGDEDWSIKINDRIFVAMADFDEEKVWFNAKVPAISGAATLCRNGIESLAIGNVNLSCYSDVNFVINGINSLL